jgi:hypothetical protein
MADQADTGRLLAHARREEGASLVVLRQIADTAATIAAELTLLRRAIERLIERGSDPPQAREFLRRPPRRPE